MKHSKLQLTSILRGDCLLICVWKRLLGKPVSDQPGRTGTSLSPSLAEIIGHLRQLLVHL